MLILSGCMSTCINLLEGSHTLHCPHQYEFRMGYSMDRFRLKTQKRWASWVAEALVGRYQEISHVRVVKKVIPSLTTPCRSQRHRFDYILR